MLPISIARAVLVLGALSLCAMGASPSGCATPGGGGTNPIAKTKYTCTNGSVEVASETTCGDWKHCEDLCQHSGGSGAAAARLNISVQSRNLEVAPYGGFDRYHFSDAVFGGTEAKRMTRTLCMAFNHRGQVWES
jgi:hypothetical protein